nr:MAG TPA: Protein of unknown function (DUF1353) [Bacteriophage sp.]
MNLAALFTWILFKLGIRKIADKNTETDDPILKIQRPTLQPYNKDQFKNAVDYTYKDVTVPVGYLTNGANIPRPFWSLFPPNSPEYLSAALVHDYMYDQQDYKKADRYFKEMLKALGCSRLKINLFYYAVRIYSRIKFGAK